MPVVRRLSMASTTSAEADLERRDRHHQAEDQEQGQGLPAQGREQRAVHLPPVGVGQLGLGSLAARSRTGRDRERVARARPRPRRAQLREGVEDAVRAARRPSAGRTRRRRGGRCRPPRAGDVGRSQERRSGGRGTVSGSPAASARVPARRSPSTAGMAASATGHRSSPVNEGGSANRLDHHRLRPRRLPRVVGERGQVGHRAGADHPVDRGPATGKRRPRRATSARARTRRGERCPVGGHGRWPAGSRASGRG